MHAGGNDFKEIDFNSGTGKLRCKIGSRGYEFGFG